MGNQEGVDGRIAAAIKLLLVLPVYWEVDPVSVEGKECLLVFKVVKFLVVSQTFFENLELLF